MDWSNPEVWKSLRVVMDAPYVVIPLMIGTMGVGMLLRGTQIGNLRTQIGAVQARIDLEETRRKTAEERREEEHRRLLEAGSQIEELKNQINRGASPQELSKAAGA